MSIDGTGCNGIAGPLGFPTTCSLAQVQISAINHTPDTVIPCVPSLTLDLPSIKAVMRISMFVRVKKQGALPSGMSIFQPS